MRGLQHAALVLLALVACATAQGNENRCAERVVDIAFILDGSGSVGAKNFAIMRNFTADVVDTLTIAEDKTRVALIVFSGTGKVVFNLNAAFDSESVKVLIRQADYPAAGTATATALTVALNEVFSTSANSGYREGVAVAVVITDGRSQEPTAEVGAAAAALRNEGVEVFSLGIGDDVALAELELIADSPERVFTVETFTDLENKSFSQEILGTVDCQIALMAFQWSFSSPELTLRFGGPVDPTTLRLPALVIQSRAGPLDGTGQGPPPFRRLTSAVAITAAGNKVTASLSDADINAIKAIPGLATDPSTTFLSFEAPGINDTFGAPVRSIAPEVAIPVAEFTADTVGPTLLTFTLHAEHNYLLLEFDEPIVASTLDCSRLELSSSKDFDEEQLQLLTSLAVSFDGLGTQIRVVFGDLDLLAIAGSTDLLRKRKFASLRIPSGFATDLAGNPAQAYASTKAERDSVFYSDLLSCAAPAPADVVLAVDAQPTRLGDIKAFGLDLLAHLESTALRVSIVRFAGTAAEVFTFSESQATDGVQAARAALQSITPLAGPSLPSAALGYVAANLFPASALPGATSPTVVFLLQGAPGESASAIEAAAAAVDGAVRRMAFGLGAHTEAGLAALVSSPAPSYNLALTSLADFPSAGYFKHAARLLSCAVVVLGFDLDLQLGVVDLVFSADIAAIDPALLGVQGAANVTGQAVPLISLAGASPALAGTTAQLALPAALVARLTVLDSLATTAGDTFLFALPGGLVANGSTPVGVLPHGDALQVGTFVAGPPGAEIASSLDLDLGGPALLVDDDTVASETLPDRFVASANPAPLHGEPWAERAVTYGFGGVPLNTLPSSPPAPTGLRITVTPVRTSVYPDAPAVAIVVQVHSEQHAPRVAPATVAVALAAPGASVLPKASCTTNALGACLLELPVPSQLFAAQDSAAPLLHGFAGTPLALLTPSGQTVRLVGIPGESAPPRRLVMVPPHRPLFVGQSGRIRVLANLSGVPVKNFLFTFAVSPGVEVRGLSIDSARWAGDRLFNDTNLAAAYTLSESALLDAANSPQAAADSLELLCTIHVVARAAGAALVSGRTLELGDVNGLQSNTGATGLPLAAITPRSPPAIEVRADGPAVLLPVLESPQLFNMAPIDGQAIKSPIAVLAANASAFALAEAPTFVNVTGDPRLSCASPDPTVVGVDVACRFTELTGLESGGSPGVALTVSLNGVAAPTAVLTVAVWFPALPVELTPSLATVYRVAGWLQDTAPGPTQPPALRFQPSTLSVTTTFTQGGGSGGLPPFRATLNHLLTDPEFRSTASDRIRFDGLTAHLLDVGQVRIALRGFFGTVIGETTITAAASTLSVVRLEVITSNPEETGVVTAANTSAVQVVIPAFATLRFFDEEAAVLAAAVLDDGSALVLDPTDVNVTFRAVQPTSVAVDGARVTIGPSPVNGRGHAVVATWASGGGGVIASGNGTVEVAIPEPDALLVILSHNRLVKPGVLPQPIPGLVEEATLHILLSFDGGARTHPAPDAAAIQFFQPGGNLGITSINATHWRVTWAAVGGQPGTEPLSVAFSQATTFLGAGPLDIELVAPASLDARLVPYPPYPGSDAVDVGVLRTLAGTAPPAIQQAELVAALLLSDGQRVPLGLALGLEVVNLVPGPQELAVQAGPNGSMLLQPTVTGAVLLGVRYGPLETNLPLTVSDDTVTVEAIVNTTLVPGGTTARGISGVVSDVVDFALAFSDGTRLLRLFDDQRQPLYPGLITFGDLDPAVLRVDSVGRVTPVANAEEPFPVVIIQSGDKFAQVTAAVDLDPAFGDVDLGGPAGSPPQWVSGVGGDPDELVVDVFVNAAGVTIGAFEVELAFEPDSVEVADTVPSFGGGTFAWVVRADDPGLLVFSGVVGQSGAALFGLAQVRFRSRPGASSSTLQATINTLSRNDLSTTPIGGATPRPALAGDIVLPAPPGSPGGGRRRRHRVGEGSRAPVRRNTGCTFADAILGSDAACTSPSACSAPELGDTNGDCVFDVRDASFAITFLLEEALGFSSAAGQQIQQFHAAEPQAHAQLDADQDQRITVLDAAFLNLVNLGILHFVAEFEEMAMSAAGLCRLSLLVRLEGKGGRRPGPTDAAVYLDFASGSPQFQAFFDASQARVGALVVADKGLGHGGGVIQAAAQGNGTYLVSLDSEMEGSIGITYIQTTPYSARQAAYRPPQFMDGPASGALAYPALDLQFASLGADPGVVVALPGYNPIRTLTGLTPSALCTGAITPALVGFVLDLEAGTLQLEFNVAVGPELLPGALPIHLQPARARTTSVPLGAGAMAAVAPGGPASSRVVDLALSEAAVDAIKAHGGLGTDAQDTWLSVAAGLARTPSGLEAERIPANDALQATAVVPDTTPPSLVGVAVTDAGLETVRLRLTFDEPVDATSLDLDQTPLRVTDTNSTLDANVTGSNARLGTFGDPRVLEVLVARPDLTVNGSQLLPAEMDVFLPGGAVTDTAGNPVGATTATATVDLDRIRPTLLSFVYTADPGVLDLTFSERMAGPSLDPTAFRLQGSSAGAGAGGLVPTGAQVVVQSPSTKAQVFLTQADRDRLAALGIYAGRETTFLSCTEQGGTDLSGNRLVPVPATAPRQAGGFAQGDRSTGGSGDNFAASIWFLLLILLLVLCCCLCCLLLLCCYRRRRKRKSEEADIEWQHATPVAVVKEDPYSEAGEKGDGMELSLAYDDMTGLETSPTFEDRGRGPSRGRGRGQARGSVGGGRGGGSGVVRARGSRIGQKSRVSVSVDPLPEADDDASSTYDEFSEKPAGSYAANTIVGSFESHWDDVGGILPSYTGPERHYAEVGNSTTPEPAVETKPLAAVGVAAAADDDSDKQWDIAPDDDGDDDDDGSGQGGASRGATSDDYTMDTWSSLNTKDADNPPGSTSAYEAFDVVEEPGTEDGDGDGGEPAYEAYDVEALKGDRKEEVKVGPRGVDDTVVYAVPNKTKSDSDADSAGKRVSRRLSLASSAIGPPPTSALPPTPAGASGGKPDRQSGSINLTPPQPIAEAAAPAVDEAAPARGSGVAGQESPRKTKWLLDTGTPRAESTTPTPAGGPKDAGYDYGLRNDVVKEQPHEFTLAVPLRKTGIDVGDM